MLIRLEYWHNKAIGREIYLWLFIFYKGGVFMIHIMKITLIKDFKTKEWKEYG